MKRNIYLDYIRSISCLLVILFHYTSHYDKKFGHIDDYFFNVPFGFMAVATFFLLSGYLGIKNINSGNLLQYWIKRFFRLYPVYWACIIITFILTSLFLQSRAVSVKDMIVNFTMLQGFTGYKHVDGAYWTLQYELMFYAFVWVVCLVKLQKHIDKICVIWTVYSMFSYIYILQNMPLCSYLAKFNRLFLMSQWGSVFILGGLICCIEKVLTEKNKNYLLKTAIYILSSLCCIYLFYCKHNLNYSIWLSVFAVLIVIGIYLYRNNIELPEKTSRLLHFFVFIAVISYPLYLIHQNVGYVIIKAMESYGLTNEIFLIIPISIVIFTAFLLNKYIEKPMGNISKNLCKKFNSQKEN